ncbi:MAG: transglycosylase SLT domain-containing protein [Bdellovibrionota bacterium]
MTALAETPASSFAFAQTTPQAQLSACAGQTASRTNTRRDLKRKQALADAVLKIKANYEVEHWVWCRKVSEERHEKFLSTYQPMISAAAEAFDLPYAYLVCVFFTESKWDAEAKSHKGAVGLPQLLPGETMNEVYRIALSESDRAAVEEKVQSVEARTATFVSDKNKLIASLKKRRKLDEAEQQAREKKKGEFNNKGEIHLIKSTHIARTGVDKYWEILGETQPEIELSAEEEQAIATASQALARQKRGVKLKGQTPLESAVIESALRAKAAFGAGPGLLEEVRRKYISDKLEAMVVKNPAVGVALGAAYLRYILALDYGIDEKTLASAHFDRLVVSAGASNFGPTRMDYWYHKRAGGKYAKLMEILKNEMGADFETIKHMNAIKNCMEHGNWGSCKNE